MPQYPAPQGVDIAYLADMLAQLERLAGRRWPFLAYLIGIARLEAESQIKR